MDRPEIRTQLDAWASTGYDVSALADAVSKFETEEAAELKRDLRIAAEALRKGSLWEAKELYNSILKRIPNHIDALRGLQIIEKKKLLIERNEHFRKRLALIMELAFKEGFILLGICLWVFFPPLGFVVGILAYGVLGLLHSLVPKSPLWVTLQHTFKGGLAPYVLLALYFACLIFLVGATRGALAAIHGATDDGRGPTFLPMFGSVVGFLALMLVYPVWPIGFVGVILGGVLAGLCWRGPWD